MQTTQPHELYDNLDEKELERLRKMGQKLMSVSEGEYKELEHKTPE